MPPKIPTRYSQNSLCRKTIQNLPLRTRRKANASETYYGAPVKWLLFEDEIRRATLANELFIPPFPDETRIRTAAEQGIDLILIPTRWVFYDEDLIDEFTASYPDAVEYVTPELVVIDPAKLP